MKPKSFGDATSKFYLLVNNIKEKIISEEEGKNKRREI
jgi:hypothetical protein